MSTHNHDDQAYQEVAKSFTLTTLPDSEVELKGEIPFEVVETFKTTALEKIAKELEMPGFRPGHVPASIAKSRVSSIAVLEEAVDMVMQKLYPAILHAHEADVVGRPSVSITKLAEGNPVGITITAAVYPTLTLPNNWETLGASVAHKTPDDVTEEEVEKTIVSLQESRKVKAEDGTETTPLLDDEFAKSLGAFETMDALREQIKKGITEEKARAAKDSRRGAIVEKLLEGVEVSVPRVFVESEQEKILSQMREDVSRFGMSFEDYLKRVEKTEETLRTEFRDQAHKRAKLQLTLNTIASKKKLEADAENVSKELKYALEHFPEANPELVRVHIESVMRNEKALQLLESAEPKA